MVWRKRLWGRKLLTVYSYVARLHGDPKPQAEVPALVSVPADELTVTRFDDATQVARYAKQPEARVIETRSVTH
jgi:hypothetical protein